MITKGKKDARLLIAYFMNRNMEILDEMDEPEYESFLMDTSGRNVHLVNELMRQISNDQSKNQMRSALRKAMFLNRMLEKIKHNGDE